MNTQHNVQIFSDDNYTRLTAEINSWLESNTINTLIDIKFSTATVDGTYNGTMRVKYSAMVIYK